MGSIPPHCGHRQKPSTVHGARRGSVAPRYTPLGRVAGYQLNCAAGLPGADWSNGVPHVAQLGGHTTANARLDTDVRITDRELITERESSSSLSPSTSSSAGASACGLPT